MSGPTLITGLKSPFIITRTGLVERQEEIHRLEMQAETIRHFQPLFAPGQLQTLDYARMLILGYEKDPVRAQEAAAARMRRVKVILKGPRPKYHVVITESALDVTFKNAAFRLTVRIVETDLSSRKARSHHSPNYAAGPSIRIGSYRKFRHL
ncbi:Scr1 family TA system antitoxin-like transcriptional regulator [Kribbella sp. NPDC049174]|uniref:Scr1 family TA system antitoxin-like transcriptional regulator n=1 Tax=Kribbella sp. NPDC049174 TaxID=3364112 RepID=UPI00371D02F0